MIKKIAIIISLIVGLIIISAGLFLKFRTPIKTPILPKPVQTTGAFLFQRDNQIMNFSVDGKISSVSAGVNITDFAYSKKDKTIYFLRSGDIWRHTLESTSSAVMTNTNGGIVFFSLSLNSESLAYITNEAASKTPTATVQSGKFYLINLKTNGTSQLLSNISKAQISLAGWTNQNQPIIREASNSALLSPKFLIFASNPPIIKEGIDGISWSPVSGLQAVATHSSLPPNSPNPPESKIEIRDSSGTLLSQKYITGIFQSFAWSADGKYLAANFINTLIWVETSPTSKWQTVTFDKPISLVRFFPDDKIVLSTSAKTTYIVDPSTGEYKIIIDNGINPWPL